MATIIKFPRGLIEYKGDMLTPEEFAARVDIKEFEIVDSVEETWFERVLRQMEEPKQ